MLRALALATAASLLVGCASHSGATHDATASHSATEQAYASPAPDGGTFLSIPVAREVGTLRLVDEEGREFSLTDLRGRYVVIANMLTSCQEICPMTSANLVNIGRRVRAAGMADRVQVLAISVDGARDVPSRLRAYQKLFGNTDDWRLAGGSVEDLAALWTFFGAPAMKEELDAEELAALPKDWQTGRGAEYDMMHNDLVLILGPAGDWVWMNLGSPKTEYGVPKALEDFLSEDGRSRLAAPAEPTWDVTSVLSALSILTGTEIA